MSTDWGKSERLRGGSQVQVHRLAPTMVAVVFTMHSPEDADHLQQRMLDGLKQGEFKMRLRGKVTSVEGET